MPFASGEAGEDRVGGHTVGGGVGQPGVDDWGEERTERVAGVDQFERLDLVVGQFVVEDMADASSRPWTPPSSLRYSKYASMPST